MADIKDIDLETAVKKKKRQRASTVLRTEDNISRLQYEESKTIKNRHYRLV